MPSEAQQAESGLEQPWKKWHADLNPSNIPEVRDGTLVLKSGDDDSGNHGTTSLEKKYVNLDDAKEKPVLEKTDA